MNTFYGQVFPGLQQQGLWAGITARPAFAPGQVQGIAPPGLSQFPASVRSLLAIMDQVSAGWMGFLSLGNTGAVGAAMNQAVFFPAVQSFPSFAPPVSSGRSWGWRDIYSQPAVAISTTPPPVFNSNPVSVNPSPYALLPAGQGSAA